MENNHIEIVKFHGQYYYKIGPNDLIPYFKNEKSPFSHSWNIHFGLNTIGFSPGTFTHLGFDSFPTISKII